MSFFSCNGRVYIGQININHDVVFFRCRLKSKGVVVVVKKSEKLIVRSYYGKNIKA